MNAADIWPDPRTWPFPQTYEELERECTRLLEWGWEEDVDGLWRLVDPRPLDTSSEGLTPDDDRPWAENSLDGEHVFAQRLVQLVQAGVRLFDKPVPFGELDVMSSLRYSDKVDRLTTFVVRLREWSAESKRKPVEPKPVEPAVADDPYLPAELPSRAAKRIERHLDTLKKYIDDGVVRCKVVNTKAWRLHKDDVRKLGGRID